MGVLEHVCVLEQLSYGVRAVWAVRGENKCISEETNLCCLATELLLGA